MRPWILAASVWLAVVLTGPAEPAAAVNVERVVSRSGIEAWLVRDSRNPIISMRFAFRGGSALDPADKQGLANMTAALLDEGAGDLDSQAFQKILEDLSISLQFDAGHDTFNGRLKTIVENKDEAFRLLALSMTAPRFDEDAVLRIRSQILAQLRRASEDPDSLAGERLFQMLFPAHPYGRRARGTTESVEKIAVEDLRGFVRGRLGRDNLRIGVVGDITPETLAPLLDSTFGGLPAKAAAWDVPDVRPQGAGKTVVIRKPIPQSVISFAGEGLARKDRDFYAATVMNHMLGGGGFTSRLYNEVREKRGLAYSVGTSLHPLDRAALLLGGAGTANAQAAETIRIVREEWSRFAEKGVTEEDLADAKAYLTGSFPLRFTASDHIASTLVGMQLDDLGIDYLERRNGLIDAVTRDDVNRVARTYLDGKALVFVVVGSPAGVESSE